MASILIDLLIGKVVSALEIEVSSLGSVSHELDELKRELISMKSFLEDAEKERDTSESQKTWVASVRDIAFDVEDIINDYAYHLHRRIRRRFGFLDQIIHFPRTIWINHRTATKLQKIMVTIKAVSDRQRRYHIDVADHARWPEIERVSLPIDDGGGLVGMERESRFLEKILMNEEAPQLTVVSMVGMGGSGKTTLAAEVYNNERIKHHFDYHAWVCVSQKYESKDLLRNLIREFYEARKELVPPDLGDKSLMELAKMLFDFLNLKKYLIVLDDVWDSRLLEVVKVLPNNQLGSRILLTTRQEGVASFSFDVRSHTLRVQPLAEGEAWKLFSMKAFASGICPRELEPFARELVKKCEGVPLAIVALGGLMHSKKVVVEWSDICNRLNWHLSNNLVLKEIKSILLLSFNDLPFPLKHCFLYCCLFPEDYLIRRKHIIKLWMAEGFVQKGNRITPEEQAENYLMQLISRNLLQVVERNQVGRPRACKMHDLIRELALSISERDKFCSVYDGQISIEEIRARRLSVQTINSDLNSYKGISQLRSFLVFPKDNSLPLSNTLLSKFKLLRVLDLEDVPIERLPYELGNLVNLTYLSLKRTQVAKLPKSIGRFHNVQTLDIRDTPIKELPKEVSKLHNLRCLLMYRYNSGFGLDFKYANGMRAPFKMCKLKKLQAVSCVQAEGDTIRQFGSLTQLTRIGISNVRSVDENDLCSSISNLKLLHYLFLMVTDEDELLRVHNLSSPPPRLQKLFLVGKLEKVPRWFSSLQCVTYLHLHWSRSKEDLLPHIASLPSLGDLTLINAFIGEKLHFHEGFSKLTRLRLINFPGLKEINIEKGVMPEIELLCLIHCMGLNELPQGIEWLSNLQELMLVSVSLQLIESVRGNDRSKVRHIPEINHYYRSSWC